MFRLSSAKLASALFKADKDTHIADIAVLKSDAMGVRTRPELAAALGELDTIDTSEHDLGRLAQCADGTLGRAYAAFMHRNGLSPFVLTSRVSPEIVRRNLFTVRYASTHDLFHVLLGFDTSWPGELGVLGFAVAQRYAGFQRVAALMAFLLYPLWSGFRVRALMEAWRRGYAMGLQAPNLLVVPLERSFERPLTEVRRELGLAVERDDNVADAGEV